MSKGKLIVLVGPTAVGKTGMAIRLAKHFNTEVISADSRQVFREMEIGTAKPEKEELGTVPHHFVNSRSIAEGYDAGTYSLEARKVIDGIFERNAFAVLCGGSGLYIKAVLEGFDDYPPIPAQFRQDLISEFDKRGLAWLRQELSAKDPDYFEFVDRNNPQRMMRALEVIRFTGKPFSGFQKKEQKVLPFEASKIGLTLEREILYQRIDSRMDAMIAKGLFAEAESLFPRRHLSALQTVGYQEIFDFLEGKYDRDEAVRLLKRNSRHYAKRQLTWFRKDKEIQWFHPEDWIGILAACESNQLK
jgi:tRNA dimethylallyltransferase